MSRILVDEEFVAVQPSLIRALDGKVVDALVLQYLHFWLRVSTNEYEDQIWVYNTYQDWSDRLGISADQARRSIERLEKAQVILSCQPQAGEWNHRKWYRIDYSHSCLIDLAELPDRSGGIARSSSYTERTNREDAPPSPGSPHQPAVTQPTEDGKISENESGTGVSGPANANPTVENGGGKLRNHSPGGNSTGRQGADDTPDPEVVRLCELLADLYHGNGNTRPNPNQKAWYRECRLLMTKDGPDGTGWPVTKIENVMRWGLENSFWKTNLRSMPKFRTQFDTVRGQAIEEHNKAKGTGGPQSNTDKIAEYRRNLEAK